MAITPESIQIFLLSSQRRDLLVGAVQLHFNGEAGRLDFLALAERARASGNQPPKLFVWLLKHKRFDFIAQANEDAAAARLRA
jgi:hypothetical protein